MHVDYLSRLVQAFDSHDSDWLLAQPLPIKRQDLIRAPILSFVKPGWDAKTILE